MVEWEVEKGRWKGSCSNNERRVRFSFLHRKSRHFTRPVDIFPAGEEGREHGREGGDPSKAFVSLLQRKCRK
jgi:hypothetical protein